MVKHGKGWDEKMITAACIILILGGFLFCTLGYAVIRVYCGFVGLLMGFVLGGMLGMTLLLGSILTWVLALSGALVLCGLCSWLYRVGMALAGALTGYALVLFLFQAFDNDNLVLPLIGAALGAACAVFFAEEFLVFGTASGGAVALITGLFVLFSPLRNSAQLLELPIIPGRVAGILLASILMAALAGASLQAMLVKRRRAIDESLRPPK